MRWVVVGAVIVALGVGSVEVAGAADIEPLVVGWERFFTIEWEVTEQRGAPVVHGYVRNTSPYAFGRLQILADTLDSTGRVVAQEFAWVPGVLNPFDRLYFEVRMKTPGQAYRIRMLAFDRQFGR